MARKRLSARGRWLWGIGGALAVSAAVMAALVFQPWLLFIDVEVNDAIPSTVATTVPDADPTASATVEPAEEVSPAPPAGPVELLARDVRQS